MGHHDHDHDHKHQHDHSEHASKDTLTFPQKARRLLEHWIHHNEDHASSYRQWAEEFRKNDLAATAEPLEKAAQATADINRSLEQALTHLAAQK